MSGACAPAAFATFCDPLPVLLALCVSRLILVSPGCIPKRLFFSLLCPRFTVPEYYCSRARLRPRFASSQSGTDPALLSASSAEDRIPSTDTYSAPVAAHGSACTSRYPRRIAISYSQDRRCLYTSCIVLSTWHAPSVSDTVPRPARLAAPNTVPSNGPTYCCKCSTLASARSPAPASTLTPTPRVRHAAQAVQLESYLDYGASRSAEVGVRPEHQLAARGPLRQALAQALALALALAQYSDFDGEVAGNWYAAPTRATPAQAQSVRARFRTGGVIGTYRRAAKGPVAQVRATSGVRRGA